MTDLTGAASEALRIATEAPARARALAHGVEVAARQERNWAVASIAARAQGVAALHMRDLDAASRYLRAAIRAAQRASSSRLVGEARMSLAATLLVRGYPRRAIAAISSSLDCLDGVAAARAMTQRAAIYQVLGLDNEALTDLRRALPVLRQAGDVQWQTRVHTNRSLLLITRRQFAGAEADLLAARTLCADNGLALSAAYVEQNLGVLKASQGNVVAALDQFDRAERGYLAADVQVPSLLADRAEVYLSTRLVEEARSAAEAAVAMYRAQNRSVSIPNARLLLSTVALVQGDTESAIHAAEQAIAAFRRLRRPDGLALARLARLQAIVAAGQRTPAASQARRCAADLAAVGWLVPSLEARVLAGRLALARGNRAAARHDLRLASRARHAGPADARARAWLAEALLRRADGRRRAASIALSTGLRVVEDHQATLGATELRAHVSVHRGALARVGLAMALEDGNARRVLSWAERGRASALLLRAPVPPDDSILAEQLADLRQTMSEINECRATGAPIGARLQRQVELERAIADRSRRLPPRPGSARAQPRSLAELCADLADAALVEYVESDGILHSVTVVRGRVRLRRLGAASIVSDALVHLPFALHRLARPSSSPASRLGASAALSRIRQRLDALLMAPLARDIGDRPLVVVPTGALQSLPWAIVPSCRDRAVTVVPSAALWHSALHRRGNDAVGYVASVAGPELPGARDEATAVAKLHSGASLLVDEQASAAAVCSAMDGASLVHVAAHGRLRSDNPLFSALQLADGPLTVYDLQRLRCAPTQVVLAACEAAQPHVLAGDEVLGLAVALLAQGTSSLIAPLLPILDTVTVDLMLEYHRQLVSGVLPAFALTAARQKVSADGSAGWAAGAGFICMGVGIR